MLMSNILHYITFVVKFWLSGSLSINVIFRQYGRLISCAKGYFPSAQARCVGVILRRRDRQAWFCL